jgi:predicted PolB exonuclease-like 3'-5' exonuclease
MNRPTLVLDIETLPNELDDVHSKLLDHKLRNVAEDKKEIEKLRTRFRYPQYARVCCIGVRYDNGNVSKEGCYFDRTDEERIIRDFFEMLFKIDPLYVHFNGFDFDVPFLLFKAAQYGIEPPKRFCNLQRFRFDFHYDIMQVLSFWGKTTISLAEACVTFGVGNPKDHLKDLDTLTFMQTASDAEIQDYNGADVNAEHQLYNKISKILQ